MSARLFSAEQHETLGLCGMSECLFGSHGGEWIGTCGCTTTALKAGIAELATRAKLAADLATTRGEHLDDARRLLDARERERNLVCLQLDEAFTQRLKVAEELGRLDAKLHQIGLRVGWMPRTARDAAVLAADERRAALNARLDERIADDEKRPAAAE